MLLGFLLFARPSTMRTACSASGDAYCLRPGRELSCGRMGWPIWLKRRLAPAAARSSQRAHGQSLRELCNGLSMARQSVTKHLAVLEAAGVVTTSRRGREKLHFPQRGAHQRHRRALDGPLRPRARRGTRRRYTRTGGPPDERDRVRLHHLRRHDARAAVAGAHRSRFHAALLGCRALLRLAGRLAVLWKEGLDEEPRDLGQVVLEAEPQRRLSYTWHHPRPNHAEMLGWSAERLAEAQREPRSRATFALEPPTTRSSRPSPRRLRARNPDARRRQRRLATVLANLKTLLETGDTMHAAPVAAAAGAEEPQS